MFHVLTDGTGAFEFLKAILSEYLQLKYDLEELAVEGSRAAKGDRRDDAFGKYYQKALESRSLIRQEINKMLEGVDLIVGPTVPKLPHEIGAELDTMEMYAYDVLTVIANLAGIPAASIKAGEVDGIPVGLQLQAKPQDDAKIIKAMAAFEKA